MIDDFQFSSVTQSCQTLWNPMDCSTLGFPVHHQLLELAQIHVHHVGDAIQPSHLISSHPHFISSNAFPPVFNVSQHQGLFQWVSSSHQMAKILELQFQHQSFQWIFRTDLRLTLALCLDSFFFFVCVIYCIFLVCGYHEVLIQQPIYKQDCFKLQVF